MHDRRRAARSSSTVPALLRAPGLTPAMPRAPAPPPGPALGHLPTPNDSAAAARPPIPRCEHDRTLDPWLARRESPPTVRDRSCSAPAARFHVERDRLTRRRRARSTRHAGVTAALAR